MKTKLSLRPFRQLLSPVRIGNHVLKSRLLYPNASPHFLQGPETYPAAGYRTYHASVARNGASIVTISEWDRPDQHVGPEELDFTHMQSWRPTDPSVQNYMSLMVEDIHFYGAKVIANLEVDWPEGYSLYGGPRPGPPAPGGGPRPTNEPIPLEMIPEVKAAFLRKVRRYKVIGYDGMTMRCDIEILPKPATRDDEYDPATIAGRSLFLRELYAAVKEEYGGDFITEAQIAWEQPWGYGPVTDVSITSDEVMEFCKLADPHVDIFQIRERDGTRSHPTGYNFSFGDHPALDYAVRMKQAGITALLAPIGGFQEPEEMEQYLREGKCDMFGVARAFIADPDYGQKMLEGRSDDIIPCLKCNACHGKILDEPDPWVSTCCVNPKFGLEHELPSLIRETTAKRVCVIGGGAIGMRAAIEAAQRGHHVALYEKSDALGGQLVHADHFDFKWPLRNYKNWLIRQLDKHDVRTFMNCEPTPAMIEAEEFDVVLAATGAVPHMPVDIAGMFDENGIPNYPTCDEMWGQEAKLGDHVIIVGGSEAGVEMAIYLLRAGHKVTVLTRQDRIAHDASGLHYITTSFVRELPDGSFVEAPEWERYDRFNAIVHATTTRLQDSQVTYQDHNGQEHVLDGDDIVICGGHRNRTDEALAYADAAAQFYAIGDCVGAGDIQVGTRQAFARAHII